MFKLASSASGAMDENEDDDVPILYDDSSDSESEDDEDYGRTKAAAKRSEVPPPAVEASKERSDVEREEHMNEDHKKLTTISIGVYQYSRNVAGKTKVDGTWTNSFNCKCARKKVNGEMKRICWAILSIEGSDDKNTVEFRYSPLSVHTCAQETKLKVILKKQNNLMIFTRK